MDGSDPTRIVLDDFRRVELKIGKVTEVSAHPNADRLWVVKVDLGEAESRQLVAGIKKAYSAEQLIGKSVVVVANLQAATLRGVESQGMILAVASGEDIVVLTTDREVPPGARVS